MIKTIKLREGVEITLANDTMWAEHYQSQFGVDVVSTIVPLLLSAGPLIGGVMEENGDKMEITVEAIGAIIRDPERMLDIARGLGAFNSTDIMHIMWAMAKAYDEKIPDHIKWQKELAGPDHESMPIAKVILPAIAELVINSLESSFWPGLQEKAKSIANDLKPEKKKTKKKK